MHDDLGDGYMSFSIPDLSHGRPVSRESDAA
jgi:hypothetical protein